MEKLTSAGGKVTPEYFNIRAWTVITMPYHVLWKCVEEGRWGDAKFGSTRRGIAPVYSDKYAKKIITMRDIFHEDILEKRVKSVIEWKNLDVQGTYKSNAISKEEVMA